MFKVISNSSQHNNNSFNQLLDKPPLNAIIKSLIRAIQPSRAMSLTSTSPKTNFRHKTIYGYATSTEFRAHTWSFRIYSLSRPIHHSTGVCLCLYLFVSRENTINLQRSMFILFTILLMHGTLWQLYCVHTVIRTHNRNTETTKKKGKIIDWSLHSAANPENDAEQKDQWGKWKCIEFEIV